MSESETEERRDVNEPPLSSNPTTSRETVIRQEPVASTVPVQREQIIRNEATVPERHEGRIFRRRTNTAAIVAIVIGIIVLIAGIYLVLTLAKAAPAPYSYIAAFIVGVILIAVGARLVTTRTSGV